MNDENVENDALPSEPDATSSLALSSTGSGAVFHAEHGAGSSGPAILVRLGRDHPPLCGI
jgi:hypothetical protein